MRRLQRWLAARLGRPAASAAVVAARDWAWVLFACDDGRYVVDVLIGRVGVGGCAFVLNGRQRAAWLREGPPALDAIAARVRATQVPEGRRVHRQDWPALRAAVDEWVGWGRPGLLSGGALHGRGA